MYKPSAFACLLVILLLCCLLYEVQQLKQSRALQDSSSTLHQEHQPQQRLQECSNSHAKFTCPKDDGFDRERIVFVHLPKAGGTSFRTWLQVHFQPANRSWFYHHRLKPPTGWFTDNHLVASFESGHEPALSMLGGARVNATVVTILRDPTSRLLSYYYYSHQTKKNDAYKFASFEQFVDSLDEDGNKGMKLGVYLYGRGSLKQAQEFLEKRVSLVGIYERMPETLWLARELLPWLKEVPFPNRNKGNYSYSLEMIPARTLKKLHFHYQKEYQLYAAAQKIFNEQLQCVAGELSKLPR